MPHSHHVYHWLSFFGSGLAVYGAITGDKLRESAGVFLAIVFSCVSAGVYIHQVVYTGYLKRSAAREQYRREQELLEAEHKTKIAQLAGTRP